MKQYLVIGLGRFGTSVAQTLYESNEEVLAIDANEEKVQDCINDNIVDNAIVIANCKSAMLSLRSTSRLFFLVFTMVAFSTRQLSQGLRSLWGK